MGRAKRDAKPFTMKMDSATYERLEAYCEASGQTKTVAIERAVNAYIDEYEKQQAILKEHERK